jgi:magnesium transporter
MLTDYYKPEILELIEKRSWVALRDALAGWPAPEVADLILHLRKKDRVLLFRVLPRPLASRVFRHLRPGQERALLADLTDEETRGLLAELSPDDRTHILAELPGQVTQRLLNLLPPEELEQARSLLGYPEESVGRLMTPHYVAVHPEWSIAESLSHIRSFGMDRETINRIYVVDVDWRLLGDISLRRIILADPDDTAEQVMVPSRTALSAFADREDAVRLIRRYGLETLPVIDSDGVLMGIVTIDDLLDVAVAEATEDFQRVGSVEPFRGSLRDAGIGFLYRRRIGWLLVLVFVNLLSGAAIAAYEGLIEQVVALVVFLPLLIASAGNAGSQASTLMIRALATGDVHARDWLRLLGKEVVVAAVLGGTMAVAVSGIGFWRGGIDVALIVAITMVLVVVIGSLVGMLLPFLLNRLDFDPATASVPLVTSIADISGVLVYFAIASAILT